MSVKTGKVHLLLQHILVALTVKAGRTVGSHASVGKALIVLGQTVWHLSGRPHMASKVVTDPEISADNVEGQLSGTTDWEDFTLQRDASSQ